MQFYTKYITQKNTLKKKSHRIIWAHNLKIIIYKKMASSLYLSFHVSSLRWRFKAKKSSGPSKNMFEHCCSVYIKKGITSISIQIHLRNLSVLRLCIFVISMCMNFNKKRKTPSCWHFTIYFHLYYMKAEKTWKNYKKNYAFNFWKFIEYFW